MRICSLCPLRWLPWHLSFFRCAQNDFSAPRSFGRFFSVPEYFLFSQTQKEDGRERGEEASRNLWFSAQFSRHYQLFELVRQMLSFSARMQSSLTRTRLQCSHHVRLSEKRQIYFMRIACNDMIMIRQQINLGVSFCSFVLSFYLLPPLTRLIYVGNGIIKRIEKHKYRINAAPHIRSNDV